MAPTPDQIKQVQSNVNNLMDWINHVHDYLQDVINEVYDKISESPDYDPAQQFVTNLMDSALWSIGSLEFPGAGVVSSFLGTFFGSYSGPSTPPSLKGTFGNVWARFDKTFLQANSDLSVIYGDVAGNWNNTYTNPVTGAVGHVSDLGNGQVSMPAKTDKLFQTMTDTAVAAYRISLTKQTLGGKWFVLQDPKGVFYAWNESQVINFAKGFIAQQPAYMVSYHTDTGGSLLSPQNGYTILENFLGTGSSDPYFAGSAPADLCNWLFQDDGFGTATNSNGIAQRRDVFYHWGLNNSLRAVSRAIDDTSAVRSMSSSDQVNAANWVQLFDQKPRQEVEKQVILKAQQDPAFRNQLLSDPKSALAPLLGLTLPDFISLEIIKETPDTFKIALPLIGAPDTSQMVETVKVGAWPDLFSQTPRQEVEKQIILKSQQDPEFLYRLVRDPKTTLQSFLGITFPESVQVDVIQETPDKYKFVLPLIGVPAA